MNFKVDYFTNFVTPKNFTITKLENIKTVPNLIENKIQQNNKWLYHNKFVWSDTYFFTYLCAPHNKDSWKVHTFSIYQILNYKNVNIFRACFEQFYYKNIDYNY